LPTYSWDHQRHWIDAPGVGADADVAGGGGGRRARVADWFERPIWKQSVPVAPLAQSSNRVLFLSDDHGLAEEVGRELAAAGSKVVYVTAGDAWSGRGDR